jgi:DNA-binding transcriptional ArsR family regulator
MDGCSKTPMSLHTMSSMALEDHRGDGDGRTERERADAIAQLLRSVAHPTRVRALLELQRAELSPTEMKPRLADPELTLPTLAYHVRTLADGGLIELTGATPRRGAMEHHYALTSLGEAMVAALQQLSASGLPVISPRPRQGRRLDF